MALNRVFHTPEIQRVEFLDSRFYKYAEDVYFPSVTTILDVFPKGFGFNQWLKDVGNGASEIVERAANVGTKMHDTFERMANGETVTWAAENGKAAYTEQEWIMIASFVEFFATARPQVLATETQIYSEKYQYAGTIDLVCMINGLVYLIDYKTSNYLHKTHELQLSAYANAWNEHCEKTGNPTFKIDRTAILWLKASTRGPQSGKIQGKGWQLKEDFGRPYENAFNVFGYVRAIWDEENPDCKPKNLTMQDSFSIAEYLSI